MSRMSGHSSVVAWVFTAIAGTKPEQRERLVLAELLDGADYFNHAVLGKDELEHGIRDLVAARLVNVDDKSFALTTSGAEIWEGVWREYESDPRGNHAINVANERLKGVECVADRSGGW